MSIPNSMVSYIYTIHYPFPWALIPCAKSIFLDVKVHILPEIYCGFFHKTSIDFSLDFGTQFPSLSRGPSSNQKSTPIFSKVYIFWPKVYLTLSAGALILTERHYTFCKEPSFLAESHFFSRSPYFWRAVCCEGLASFLYVLIVSLAEAIVAEDISVPASTK